MTFHTGFVPDPERAAGFDRRMHSELAASLRHVLAQSEGVFPVDRAPVDALIADLEAGTRYPPTAFGRYYDLVGNLLDDDLERAERTLTGLVDQPPADAYQRVAPLQSPERCPRSRLYRDRLMAEMAPGISVQPPDPGSAEVFEQHYRAAMQLLHRAVPELAGEIESLVREVVPIAGGADDEGVFEGASHYQLWGALFLNAAPADNRVAMAEMIAHESAHGFLFGCCIDEPLVYNDDDERFPSPLRSDPRPMDGIFHATFVSARMHWTMSRLLASDELNPEEAETARAARDDDARNFADGDRVIQAHAELSRHAAELIAGARSWMAGVGA